MTFRQNSSSNLVPSFSYKDVKKAPHNPWQSLHHPHDDEEEDDHEQTISAAAANNYVFYESTLFTDIVLFY